MFSGLKNKDTIRNVAKVICFVILLCLVVLSVQKPFIRDEDHKRFQHLNGFYAEPKNSLDAVYVGASNVYPWYEPPIAWDNYGIKTFDLSVPGMPARAVRYTVEEALKTQPDALYVFNLNNFKNWIIGYVRIHNIVDYFHFSTTKINMINDLAEHSDIRMRDRMEFYLPLIRIHSGWSELKSEDFVKKLSGFKGGDSYLSFFHVSQDQTSKKVTTSERNKPRDYRKENLKDLVDYLKARKVKALFISEPQAVNSERYVSELNTLADYVESEGFDVLNLLDEDSDFDDVGIEIKYDFKDAKHVNIHGAQKYTKYLAAYLQKKYGFKDQRKKPGSPDWDEAVKKYYGVISQHTLDFERDLSKRSLELVRPGDLACKVSGRDIKVTWSPVEGAEKYYIYRKQLISKDEDLYTSWKKIAETENGATSYTDSGLKKKKTYYYTVVPVKFESGKPVYGCFDYQGVSGKTGKK